MARICKIYQDVLRRNKLAPFFRANRLRLQVHYLSMFLFDKLDNFFIINAGVLTKFTDDNELAFFLFVFLVVSGKTLYAIPCKHSVLSLFNLLIFCYTKSEHYDSYPYQGLHWLFTARPL